MTIETEILRLIYEKGEKGSSWSDLEVTLVLKDQLSESLRRRLKGSKGEGKYSKGAFVNAFKNLQKQKAIKKVLIEGKPRYVIVLKVKEPHITRHSLKEYTAKIGHTRDLIPGLKNLLNYGVVFEQTLPHYQGIPLFKEVDEKLLILTQCAESHLRKYPKIKEKRQRYKELSDKYNASDEQIKKQINLLKGNIIPLYSSTNDLYAFSVVSKKLTGGIPEPLFISEKEADYLIFGTKINEISSQSALEKSKGMKDRMTINVKGKSNFFPTNEQGYVDNTALYELLKLAVPMEETYEELKKEINKLIIRCNHEPLDGKCELCPNFTIKNS